MNWFFLALIGPFLWSVGNHIDKYLIEKYFKGKERGIGALMIISCLIGIFILPIIFLVNRNVVNIHPLNAFFLILLGIAGAIAILFYFFALEEEEATIVIPLYQLIPVFGYIFGLIILKEVLAFEKIIGCLLVVLGATVLSLEIGEEEKLTFKKKPFVYMVLASIILAFSDVVFKKIAIVESFWTSEFWNYIGLVIFGFFLLFFIKSYRKEFFEVFNKSSKKIIAINLFNETIFNFGMFCFSYATLLVPVVYVMIVNSYQPVFVFIEGLLLTIFWPKISTEKITKKHLIHKGLSILVIVIGSFLVYK